MPTTALFHWRVAGSPVEVLIDLALVDRLRIAGASSDVEIGGILLGYYDGNYSVINDFEAIDSEHRRGAAYTLSQRDESRLGNRLEAKRKRGTGVPVGFFRTHLRPGMFLDEGDNHVLAAFFSNVKEVALLIKPAPDRSATGGFFFWEEGEMNRKQSYLPFPMSSRDLEGGDFPLVEPVAAAEAAPAEAAPAAFENAETLDSLHTNGVGSPVRPPEDGFPHSRSAQTQIQATGDLPAKASLSRNLPWQLIGLVAALAAFGGYLIGTSGSRRDRFGARSGDITLNSSPPEPAESVPAQASPADRSARPGAMPGVIPGVMPGAAPGPTPGTETAANAASSPPQTGSTPPVEASGAKQEPVAPVNDSPKTVPPVTQPALPARQKPFPPAAQVEKPPVREPNISPPLPSPAPPVDNNAGWQHFHTDTPAQTAAAAPAPAPVLPSSPRDTPAPPAGLSSVYLEAVESGSVGKAISKIPLFGALHRARSGDKFTPPQALRSAAPRVPANLARELTGTLPVDLRLKVDATGRVSSVEILSPQSPAEWVRLAGDAAYDWQFEPARVKDKVVSSEVIAHFKFRPAL